MTRPPYLWLPVVVVAALFGETCGEGAPNGDGGIDASAALDAHPHVPDVGGADAARLDAPDATRPGDPGWVHLREVPADCVYEIATHPENVPPGIADVGFEIPMVDCGAGCRRTAYAAYSPNDVFRVDGRTLAILGSSEAIEPGNRWIIRTVVDLDGATIAATRFQNDFSSPVSCGTEHFGGGGVDVGFEVNFSRYDAAGDHVIEASIGIHRGRYDDLAATVHRVGEEVFPAGRGGAPVTTVGLGPGVASYEYVGTIAAVQTDGVARVVSGALRTNAPFHIGSDIVFDGFTTDAPLTGVLARSVHGADATWIRTVTGGDILRFGSDGETLAWLEGLGWDATARAYASLSLWSGTYDGDLHATRVGDFVERGVASSGVGGGYFVVAVDDATSGHNVYAVHRLSDGARAIFDPIAAGGTAPAERVAFVAADEMVFDTTGTLWRVDPRILTFVP